MISAQQEFKTLEILSKMVSKLIIGSTAIKHYFPDFPREPNDLDYVVVDRSKFKKEIGIEYLENPVILKYQKEGHLTPELMTSLKVSHLLWETNWEKHLFDLQFLLKKGFKWDLELVRELREYWHKTLPKVKRSQLEMTKEDFFTNNVNKDSNEHDFLHTLIAEIPAYTKILKDGAEVELDQNKWDKLSFEEKCDVVQEETYVMAFERYKEVNFRIGYKGQLIQNIQKHFPEFIGLFAIENYISLEKPKFNYINKIENELQIN